MPNLGSTVQSTVSTSVEIFNWPRYCPHTHNLANVIMSNRNL